jgi:hypothetical protein
MAKTWEQYVWERHERERLDELDRQEANKPMIEKQPPLEAIVAALADLDAEYRTEEGADDWVTVPIGHDEAIEIELPPTDMNTQPDGDSFAVYTRTWDRTHALDTEIFLAVVTHGLVPRFVRGVIAEYEASARAAERAMAPYDFTYTQGSTNVNYLEAPYALLVQAFGDDGTVSPRDESKCMCTWDVETKHGAVDVYDYKIGKSYDPDGLDRAQITDWHVQGEPEAIREMLAMLERYRQRGEK